MKYYVTTTEQVYNDGNLGEYMTKSDAYDTEKAARNVYYKKLGDINADLSPNGHAYGLVEVRDSKGVIETGTLGEYVEA